MSKQSSIEWLVKQLELDTRFNGIMNDVIQQAKQMHKEEIEKAFEVGYENGACVNDDESIYHGSNYYQKTYGGNNE